MNVIANSSTSCQNSKIRVKLIEIAWNYFVNWICSNLILNIHHCAQSRTHENNHLAFALNRTAWYDDVRKKVQGY